MRKRILPLVLALALLLSACSSTVSSNVTSAVVSTPGVATAAASSGTTAASITSSVATVSARSAGTVTAGNTVPDNSTKTSYNTTTTVSGSLTSYTGRSDNFSIGYYISDGQFISSKSILAKSNAAASSLDLNLAANGYGFTPVYATGKNTTLDVTGKITTTDTSDGTYASDFTGLGAQVIASYPLNNPGKRRSQTAYEPAFRGSATPVGPHLLKRYIASNYAKVNVNNMSIHTTGFAHAAFIADNHGQIIVTNSTITTMGANPLTQAYSGYKTVGADITYKASSAPIL